MSDRNIDGEGVASGRDYARVLLSLGVVLGVVLATALLPALPGVAGDSVPDPMTGATPSGQGGGAGAAGAGGAAGAAGAGGQGGQSGQNSQSSSAGQSTSESSEGGGSKPGRGEGSGSGRGSGSSLAPSGGGGSLGALSVGDRTKVGGLDANGSAFQSTSQQVHFVVAATRPSYWRTGTFDRYTGDGWRSTADVRPYDGGRLPRQGQRDHRIVQRVTLCRSATSLPAAWRPVELAGPVEGVRVTDARAFRTEGTPANTTYAVASYEPPRDPDLLRSTGTDYPAAVERRYTRLPESTDRLRAFTDDLTANARSPYGRAVRIERWLERNKRYSLNASRPDGDVATEFVFGMEQGYCEYFATAMTVMLRTQDVPARYVVGYSTGQPRGDRYVVRGMNAHAWVEVYFPDVGWVRFDPTPGSERLANETQAFAAGGSGSGDGGSGPGGESGQSSRPGDAPGTGGDDQQRRAADYDHTERGSPGESFSGGSTGDGDAESGSGGRSESDKSGSGGRSESDQSDSSGSSQSGKSESGGRSSQSESDRQDDADRSGSDDAAPPSYDVALNRSSLVPGTEVTVTVTRDGDPAAGVTVLFDGDAVGETDGDGNVTGTVPYVSSLNVSVRTAAAAALGAPPVDSGRLFDVRAPPVRLLRAVDGPAVRADASGTFGVETNVTLDVVGTPIPGAPVTVRATIRDHPVPEATVRLDGTTVGRTNESGSLRVSLPDDGRQVRLTARRGDANGSRNVSLVTDLDVRVTEPTVPGGNVTVDVRANGTAVPNATVVVDDRPAGRTAADGDVAVTLPDVTGNVTVVASRGVASGNATVELERLTVTAASTLPVAFPWTGLRIRTELDGDPVGGVDVRVNDRRVGATGPKGTLTATYPPATGTTVVATGYHQTVRTDGGTPLAGPAILVGLLALVFGYGRRRGLSPRGLTDDAAGLVVRLCRRTVALVVAVASRVDALLARLLDALARLREDVRALPGMLRAWLRAVRARLLAVARRVRAGLERVRGRLVAAGAWLAALRHEDPRTLARALYAWLVGLFRGHEGASVGDADGDPGRRQAAVAGGEEADPRLTIQEAWREFLGYASVRRWQTLTPGEVATRAVERDGFPADAVATLRDAFRDVEYGGRSPDDRLDGAREALARIRRAAETTEVGD